MEKSDTVLKNSDLELDSPDSESSLVAADLSGILGTTLCGIIKLCDQQNVSIKTVIDKEWLQHFMKAYDLLFQLES